ncbi:hypothetical protein [Nonomuraea sediminis]|uniref:hypothetical protein n=1 Tax=Nonomuraea sediminis TaxID=2835864 RepID=UPI001BDBB456|nr:hypothetical protein [Nonomuraea sediminis]
MATRAPQVATVAGSALTMYQAAAADKVSGVTRETRMIVSNTTAGPVTLTVTPPGTTEYAVAKPNKVWTIPVGMYELLLLPTFRDPQDSNLISLSWSATPGATLTWAVIG